MLRLLVRRAAAIAAFASVLALGLAATPALAQASQPGPPSPTLSGETFTGTTTITQATCDPGGTSTFSFVATGVAEGPFPGSFEETGTVTIGPQIIPPMAGDLPRGSVQTFEAEFTIFSLAGEVQGTKRATGSIPGLQSTGVCVDDAFVSLFGSVGDFRAAQVFLVAYEARIRVRNRTFTDRGVSHEVSLSEFRPAAGSSTSHFRESFESDLAGGDAVQPGKGCGDKNHVHEREVECKEPPR